MRIEVIAMTLTLELPTDTEKRLQAKAGAKGLTVKSYLEELVRNDLDSQETNGSSPTNTSGTMSNEQWIAEHRALAKSHEHVTHFVDDSRESIYAGRGE
jgi:hypothetical protein